MSAIPRKKMPGRIVAAMMFCVTLAGMCLGQSNWECVNPPPQGRYTLTSVAFGNGKFVAVGVNGIIVSSTDGTTWELKSQGLQYPLYYIGYVTFQNHLFIAVGHEKSNYSSKTILVSPDGNTWSVHSLSLDDQIKSIAYGNNVFVAVSSYGTVLTSPDGATWSKQFKDTTYPQYYNSVTFGNNQFVALCSNNNGQSKIRRSSDGISWSMDTCPYYFNSIFFDGNQFVAMGSSTTMYYSSDGTTWTEKAWEKDSSFVTVYSITYATYADHQRIAIGNYSVYSPYTGYHEDIIMTSSDGIKWSHWKTLDHLYSATFGNNVFVAVIDNGGIITSPDGVSWSKTYKINCLLSSIAFGNDMFMCSGDDGRMLSSRDGKNWDYISFESAEIIQNLSFTNNRFFAGTSGKFFTSSNGNAWTIKTTMPDYVVRSVTYGNGLFTAVGGFYRPYTVFEDTGAIWTSRDGAIWNPIFTKFDLYSIAYGNNLFVAVGSPISNIGKVVTSEDGITWTDDEYLSQPFLLNSVAFGNNRFVAVGYIFNGMAGMSQAIISSLDGKKWTESSTSSSQRLNSVAFANNRFVAVGNRGEIWSSSNGTTWSQKPSGTTNNLIFVTFGNNRFMAVGDYGTILISPADSPSAVIQTTIANKTFGRINIAVTTSTINISMPLTIPGQFQVMLFDFSGRRILSKSVIAVNGTLHIPTQGLRAGTYLLEIADGKRDKIMSKITITRYL